MAVSEEDKAPLAVVTGASSGIGKELAKQFAEHGYALIVAAEDAELDEAVIELRNLAPDVKAVRTDLSDYDGVEKLFRAIEEDGRPVEAIALNAGVGLGGDFARDQDLDDALRLVNLNIVSTVHLAKRVLPRMAERGEGKVLFTSSIASLEPGPYQALYNASKSFVQSFALALRDELEDTGVTVTALMPGPTDTEFFDRAGNTDTKLGASDKKSSPAQVAKEGFEAMMAGKAKKISGNLQAKVQGHALGVLPDKVASKLHKKQAEPGSAK